MIDDADLMASKRSTVWLALAIAIGTLVAFTALGMYAPVGAVYEMRAVVAMTLRKTV
jgi:hypothetical protein